MIDGRSIRLVTMVVLAAAFFGFTAGSRAQIRTAPHCAVTFSVQAPAAERKTAEQVYKNIQVLNGLPASELDGVMNFMSASLGLGCTHCHTNIWDSDAKSPKLAARKMIVMTRNLNTESFSGNPAITCYTCHRGRPNSVPLPLVDPVSSQASSQPSEAGATPAKPPALPTSDEIIGRYILAIGREAAIAKMKTRVLWQECSG